MNETELAEAVISSKTTLPKDATVSGLVVWQSLDSLRRAPYDPRKTEEYLRVLEAAKRKIMEARTKQENSVLADRERNIQQMSDEIWKLLESAFGFYDPLREQMIALGGKLKWVYHTTASPRIVHSDGTIRPLAVDCPDEGQEVDLKPFVESWIRVVAEEFVNTGAILTPSRLFGRFQNEAQKITIRCSRTDPLVHPKLKCSLQESGTAENIGCNTLVLQIKPK